MFKDKLGVGKMNAKKEFEIHIPRWEELPEIDLYLDQVVTFIDKYLGKYIGKNNLNNKNSKEAEENKILTKTMINNYVKQKVIAAPVKKRYSKTDVAYLIIICILKQVYSINEISKLIKIALRHTSVEFAYNQFCISLENAIDFTFNGNRNFENFSKYSSVEYLLFNVSQSFASKLYVQQKYTTRIKQE